MTIHVNIGEAKTRLSELLAAAARGEEVVLNKAGVPFATLVPTPEALAIAREARVAKRQAAFGCLAEKYKDQPRTAFDIPPAMTDADYEERAGRKFG
ncbi:type II toxin-antitoxin system Phd/YefM family antitoxin [Novosphingobium taihuense]|uniref:Prevent-host-death family protein n=1 Tax=Novosphingobium taihuense TaxID=260085 RepID=A0A7W7AAI4_9SPHN|nr:type II toxin-antitoxin system prevent-host-death family antitoxin [Novosphingobium taihuense]MBB4612809.1 prevent-host-death family protein [Novosphingobium taihuense]TWH80280.1 prevent-host-death family protein [Novosphingobium taihuense]